MKFFVLICIFTFFLFFPYYYSVAGTTGTLSGCVRDSLTGKALPGVSVQIEETAYRTLTDKNGYFAIYNLSPDEYKLKLSMIGYKTLSIQKANIKADSHLFLDIAMFSDVLNVSTEIVVIAKRPLVQTDVIANVKTISGDEIVDHLPVESLQDVIELQPGCMKNHIRGGRSDEIQYLIDGLPVQDAFTRKVMSRVPLSSVSDINILTGGFNAEYGGAMSGIINIITKESKDFTEATVRYSSDNFGLSQRYENMTRLEFNLSGPIILGFGGPIYHFNYYVSGDLFLSDTQWRKEMTQLFNSPIIKNSNFNIKLSFDAKPQLKFMFQVLSTRHHWHEYNYQWRNNLTGLPRYLKKSDRYSFTLKHSLSSRFYYTVSLGFFNKLGSITGDRADHHEPLEREIPSQFNSAIADGRMQCWEESSESNFLLKSDLTYQFNQRNQIKMGIELNQFDISMKNIRYDEIPIRLDKNHFNYTLHKNDFKHTPYSGTLYLQNRIEHNDVSLSIGLRFEMLDVKTPRPQWDVIESPDTVQVTGKQSTFQSQLSPRFGILLPLSSTDQLILNYGWYVQTPPFYYYYINLEHPFEGIHPILGNPILSFEKTTSYEVQYRKILSSASALQIAFFQKRVDNLINTKVHKISPPHQEAEHVATPITYCQYVNQGYSIIYGFEFTLETQPFKYFSTSLSYTYMNSKGTTSSPEYVYNRLIWNLPLLENSEYPLNWDQRHHFMLNFKLHEPKKWSINLIGQIKSPLPYTAHDLLAPNQKRFQWQNLWSLKASVTFHSFHLHVSPYFQIINIFDDKIISLADKLFLNENNIHDPTYYLPGRRILFGINCSFY